MDRYLVIRRDRPAISWRLSSATLFVVLGALACGLLVLAAGTGSGSLPLAPGEVLAAIAGQGETEARFVVWELRLPRLLGALLVGSLMAVSGAILQSLARNPLVAPDIVGINTGAAFAAVLVIHLGAGSGLVAPAAFAGALMAAAMLYVLAWKDGLGRYRLVLVGIGIAALAEAGIGYLLTRLRLEEARQAFHWMVGSLHGVGWEDVAFLSIALLLLVPLTVWAASGLSALQLGDDAAAGLGVRIERTRLALVIIAAGGAAAAVAVAGPIAFVAFIAPHLARRLSRGSGSGLIPASAAVGAVLLILADLVARRLSEPVELPVGIVTIVLGAPFFLWLLIRGEGNGAQT